jgi:ribosomal protein S3AE
LIGRILERQRAKIEMDEEIETCDDDLNEITKVVVTKQAYNEELGIAIAVKKKQIEEE